MKHRWLVRAALILAASCIGLFVAVWLGLFARVTKVNFDAIEPGMTKWDVCWRFGALPGNYSHRSSVTAIAVSGGPVCYAENWHGDDGDYYVIINRIDGRVRSKSCWPVGAPGLVHSEPNP